MMPRSSAFRDRVASALVMLGLFVASSCANEAEPLPQLVVVIDTDALLPGQLIDHRKTDPPNIAPDATLDTVLVDVLDANDVVEDVRSFVTTDPQDWPLSFGVAAPSKGTRVRLRIRLFRGNFAVPDQVRGSVNGKATTFDTIAPPGEVTVDRLVDVDVPTHGKRTIRVVLREDCMGIPPFFGTPSTTCIDGATRSAPTTSGFHDIPESIPIPSEAGTWPRGSEVPCKGGPPNIGANCVPGGFSILGDLDFVGRHNPGLEEDDVPLHPTLMSPFYMDRTEYTVGRFRQLVLQGGFTEELPVQRGATTVPSDHCTWLGTADASNDKLPLNCVIRATAVAACAAAGGKIPSEARFEHAGRGRGRGWTYPWGNTTPACCSASFGRSSSGCGAGIEPAGSHPTGTCADGTGDETPDHILDLGGSLSELMLDPFVRLDAPCWTTRGIRANPVCDDESVVSSASRGGDWTSGNIGMAIPFRYSFGANSQINGFRCVYEDAP